MKDSKMAVPAEPPTPLQNGQGPSSEYAMEYVRNMPDGPIKTSLLQLCREVEVSKAAKACPTNSHMSCFYILYLSPVDNGYGDSRSPLPFLPVPILNLQRFAGRLLTRHLPLHLLQLIRWLLPRVYLTGRTLRSFRFARGVGTVCKRGQAPATIKIMDAKVVIYIYIYI